MCIRDRLYQSGYMSKQEAYQWLADLISAPLSEAHIGQMCIRDSPDTTHETEPESTIGKPGSEHETSTPPVTTAPSQTEPEKEEQEFPSGEKAGAADPKAVAQRVLEYVNEFRTTSAVKLTGLTDYAEYRSRQIVSNFAHDTADQRAAATELQYGEYIDPSLYGGSGEPYYRANAREAIAKAGYAGTIDEVALKLASLVKNSTSHWNYIGSPEYTYIAVGVTYESLSLIHI